MDKPTDIPEQTPVSNSRGGESNKAETVEQPAGVTTDIADEIQAKAEETNIRTVQDGIQTNVPADVTNSITKAVREIESATPAAQGDNARVNDGNEVNDSANVSSEGVGSMAEIARAEMRPQLLSRRRVITLGFSLAAGFVATFWSPLTRGLSSFWQLTARRRRDNPYYRLNKSSAVYASVGLGEGFYARRLNQDSAVAATRLGRRNIIHYVDSKSRVPFLQRVNAPNLRPALSSELAVGEFTISNTKSPPFPATHVSLGRASALFELAALKQLEAQQYGAACERLIDGIRHDFAFKKRVRGAPSLRLLDLLAIISIRRNQQEHFDTLLKLADDAMKLIDQQSIGPRASRKPKRKRPAIVSPTKPSKKGGPQDNQRKTRLPLDQAAQEVARSRRKAVLQTRLQNWKNEEWKKKRRDRKELKWAMTIPPETTKDKNKKFKVAI